MANFKERYFSLQLGQSSKPLQDFLRALGAEPVRDFVEHRMKDLNARKLQDACMDDFALGIQAHGLQFDLESLARISATLKARILVDSGYWNGPSARTCNEAFVDFLEIIDDQLGLPSVRDEEIETLAEAQQHGLLNLFGFAIDLFAALGSESKLIRSSMGIRKGIFG